MRVRIDGRHYTVTADIKNLINDGVAKFDKFLHNIIDVHVILDVEKYRQIAEIIVVAKNITFKRKEVTDDMHLSVERVLHNIERQLRQHKERVKSHQTKNMDKEISE